MLKTLAFEHPTTKEWMEFNSEIPEDMTQCIERWKNYAKKQQRKYLVSTSLITVFLIIS